MRGLMNLPYFCAYFSAQGLLGPHIPLNARELLCQEEAAIMVNFLVSLFIPIYSGKEGIFRLP
jgi:hypothetical protein